MGRPTEFGDLSPFTLQRHEYLGVARTPVRYLPVTLRGELIGYLWASESTAEDAADFCPLLGMGAVGFEASGTWRDRLKQAREGGMSPLAAVRRWKGEVADARGGGVPADAEEQTAPNSHAIQELASHRND